MKKRTMRARRLVGVAAMTAVLLATIGVLQATGQPLSSGSVGGFEDDGNMIEQAAVTGTMDWSNATGTLVTATDDSIDSGYQGSSKENEPENFACNTGGASPGKNNILRAYVNTRITGPLNLNPTTAFLDLAFVRAAGNGDAHINFEFNRNNITNQCPFEGRSPNDILITFDFPGGGGTADLSTFSWDGSNWSPTSLLPAGSLAGDTNSGTIVDTIATGNIGSREFGEATVDLVAFDTAIGGGLLACPGFGHVNIRSRSSGESFNAALQDRLPQTTVDVSTCGSVKLKKNDDAGHALPGAQFGLFDNANATGAPIYTCTSNALGICTFSSVTPADYWVAETLAPPGYNLDESAPQKVTVGFRQAVDLTATPYENPAKVGFVHINKVLHGINGQTVTPSNAAILDGTAFALYKDANNNLTRQSPGEDAHLWPSGNAATCTIAGGTSGCTIGPVQLGNYRVAETQAPPNSASAGDVNVTVTEGTAEQAVNVNYVNILNAINIALDKSAGATANVGDTVNYSFNVITTGPRLHNIALDEQTTLCAAAPVFQANSDTNSNGFLEVGETWHYSCSHVVTMQDTDPLVNTAKATGTDDYGRTVESTDNASVDILYPDVTSTKVAGPSPISAGATASFTITANVGGDNGAIAQDVHVTDTLPAGFTWSSNNGDCLITGGVNLDCSFGNMNKGATASVTVSAATSTENCGDDIVNQATITATNERQSAQANNDSAEVLVHVTCGDVSVLKTADTDIIDAGDTAAFTIVVSTDAVQTSNDVQLTDTLPAGITWSEDSADCGITGLLLTCDFGNLAPSSTRTIHVTGLTDVADCGVLSNTANVSSSNEPEGESGNNTSTAEITVLCPISIGIIKDGPQFAHLGDTITYVIDVENNGLANLVTVDLSDPICDGDSLHVVDDGNGDSVLAIGETWTYNCTHVVTASDPDPLPNTATVSGTDVRGRDAGGEASHSVDIIHPAITIDKTANPVSVEPGQSVTYTYVVKNIGDCVLTAVKVTDDKLGDIGTIASLAVGASATLTKTVTITGDSPTDNLGTATATDPLGKQVSATDTAHIDIVLPLILLARTGFDVSHWVAVGFAFIAIGIALQLTPAALRRRPS
ncbi:MAG: hypothetical protein QOI95_288 [Acidimicrobiaceae bacterium]|jgi:uncharacterized repeat protein (TIGR01451 family)